MPLSDLSSDSTPVTHSFDTPIYILWPFKTSTNQSEAQALTFVTRKYKPVAKKVRAVLAELPEIYRITCNIVGESLVDMPTLSLNPPDFQPTGHYTAERRDIIDKAHSEEFLWHDEWHLMHHFMSEQNLGFAWNDSEWGHLWEDFFPPIIIPVVEHKPWVIHNMPIPPGLFDEICWLIRTKITTRVYERSNSSYRSKWFTVLKKGGKLLQIVHSLEPLNAVTIQHSGIPPFTEQLAEHFAGWSCGGILDLYVGYDEQALNKWSHNYTTFQTPYGAFRLIALLMGWMNSVSIFHEDITFILQPEIPHTTIPYIDNIPIRRPVTRYISDDGSYETHPDNAGIRQFVWEHFQNMNRVVQRMKYCEGTFLGYKVMLWASEISHRCTYEGWLLDKSWIKKVFNWGPCKKVSEVCAFLGMVGVCQMFIRNFSRRANPLTMLTHKNHPFIFRLEQINVQDNLKQAVINSPALWPLYHSSESPVILVVDTSPIAINFHLCQCDDVDPHKQYYARFGSITLNDRESWFSQTKLELYG